MGKRNGIYARNDKLIEQLLRDPDYRIYENGEVWSLIQRTGKRSICGNWRQLKIHRHEKNANHFYHNIRYKRKYLALHRVIFRKFKGKLNPNKVINHIDGNSENNHVDNLELITQSENSRHSYEVLGRSPSRGNAKIPDEVVFQIRDDYSNGMKQSEIQKKYNVKHKSTISGICSGKLYSEKWLKVTK